MKNLSFVFRYAEAALQFPQLQIIATTARSDHDQHVNLRQKLRILDVFRSFTCHQ